MKTNNFVHKPVLLEETVQALNIKPGGIYIDATAGGGGHSAAILEKLGGSGLLICIDRDPDAIQTLEERFGSFRNVKIIKDNFSDLKNILSSLNIGGFNGLLLDIGVSSHQLDTAERGFSFHTDAPLDMRMSQNGISAYDVVNTYGEKELADIIYKYGEEKFSRNIASNIVKARAEKPVETTFELVAIIKASMPAAARRNAHPARRTFQALRIEVNHELEFLEKALDDSIDLAYSGARLAVITFHSLEDRIVKLKFREWSQGCTCPKSFPICVCGKKPRIKAFKPVSASEAEIKINPRSRSAKLRAAKITEEK